MNYKLIGCLVLNLGNNVHTGMYKLDFIAGMLIALL